MTTTCLLRWLLGLALLFMTGELLPAADIRLTTFPAEVRLPTARSRQQLLVTRHSDDGYQYDQTRAVQYESADPSIAHVDTTGVIHPRQQGTTQIRIRQAAAPGMPQFRTQVSVTVGDLSHTPPVSFTHEVMSVLGKAGCNSGACHGHNSGKGGVKLSLRGYNPAHDLQTLTRDLHGRRVNRLVPEASLLLTKPAGLLPHGGDKRFAVGSPFHRLLRQWVAEGAQGDVSSAVRLERIEVFPPSSLLPQPGLSQQLQVNAYFSDGSIRDVTEQAIYELATEGVVDVRPDGLVTSRREGEAAVLVRFLGKMSLSRFLVIRHQPAFTWTEPPVHNVIDQHVWTKLRSIQVHPSDLSSDAEFLRRVSLDTTGLPPTVAEVRAFLAETRPDKRRRKIDELLDRDEFGDLWAMRWLELSGTNERGDSAAPKGLWTLSFWLRDAINRNLPYDQFVTSLLVAQGSSLQNPAVAFTVNRLPKVEVIPQLFLGVRLECAQCHDHPFDVWKQSDYHSLQTFFVESASKEGPGDSRGREIRNFVDPQKFLPWEQHKTITLRHLDGTTVQVPEFRQRREVLAEWLFGPGKRQVARALVNRVWGKHFARGIVDPVDDMRFSNPPVNEPLLEALADEFLLHQYDFKHLVRTILNSRTYQLSSIPNASNAREEMNFSHAGLRRLSAEQLYDSIIQVTGVAEELRTAPPGFRTVQIPLEAGGTRFLKMFGRPAQRMSPCECLRSHEVTLPQVLHLLNGDTLSRKLRAEGSHLQRLLATQPDADRLVEELYLLVLSRFPTDRERQLARSFLRDADDFGQGAEDLMWALLTSQEFLFQH